MNTWVWHGIYKCKSDWHLFINKHIFGWFVYLVCLLKWWINECFKLLTSQSIDPPPPLLLPLWWFLGGQCSQVPCLFTKSSFLELSAQSAGSSWNGASNCSLDPTFHARWVSGWRYFNKLPSIRVELSARHGPFWKGAEWKTGRIVNEPEWCRVGPHFYENGDTWVHMS